MRYTTMIAVRTIVTETNVAMMMMTMVVHSISLGDVEKLPTKYVWKFALELSLHEAHNILQRVNAYSSVSKYIR